MWVATNQPPHWDKQTNKTHFTPTVAYLVFSLASPCVPLKFIFIPVMGFGHSFLRVFIWHVRFLLPIVLSFTAFLTISLKLFMFYITYLPERIDFPSAASFPNF